MTRLVSEARRANHCRQPTLRLRGFAGALAPYVAGGAPVLCRQPLRVGSPAEARSQVAHWRRALGVRTSRTGIGLACCRSSALGLGILGQPPSDAILCGSEFLAIPLGLIMGRHIAAAPSCHRRCYQCVVVARRCAAEASSTWSPSCRTPAVGRLARSAWGQRSTTSRTARGHPPRSWACVFGHRTSVCMSPTVGRLRSCRSHRGREASGGRPRPATPAEPCARGHAVLECLRERP